MQYGGCHPSAGCFDADGYSAPTTTGSRRTSTYKKRRRRSTRPAHEELRRLVRASAPAAPCCPRPRSSRSRGIKVGFIGMTLEGTPELVAQAGIKDVDFRDEVATANLAAKDLRKQGVAGDRRAHPRGRHAADRGRLRLPVHRRAGPSAISGPIVQIAQNLDPSIDMVVSGHTHQPYTCSIPDPAASRARSPAPLSYGRLVTETKLQLNRRTRDVIRSSVTLGQPPGAERRVTGPSGRRTPPCSDRRQVDGARRAGREPRGRHRSRGRADIAASIPRDTESRSVDLIADAQLERTRPTARRSR